MARDGIPEYVADFEDWQHREVYAAFGAAVYFGQVLEAAVVNHLAFLRAIRRKQGRPFDIDDVFRRLFGQTLGHNLKETRDILTRDGWPIADELAEALETRNELVHHYWRRRIMQTGTEQGRTDMLDELGRMKDQLEVANAALVQATRTLWDEAGIDFQWVEREYTRLTEVSRGEREPEPGDTEGF
jgi:hypothetical protein